MQEMTFNNVYLMDAYPLYFDGLTKILTEVYPGAKIEKISKPQDISNLPLKNENSHLVIIDIQSIETIGIDVLLYVRTYFPKITTIVFSKKFSSREQRTLQCLGLTGIIAKNSSHEKITAIFKEIKKDHFLKNGLQFHSMSRNNYRPVTMNKSEKLTKTELVILKYLMQGVINKDIALSLDVSISTIKSHVSSIIQKLGVINRTQVFTELQKFKKNTEQAYITQISHLLPHHENKKSQIYQDCEIDELQLDG